MEVVIGLRTAVGHLIKVQWPSLICKVNNHWAYCTQATATSNPEGLKVKTLLKFLCTLYELDSSAVDKAFTQIGIHRCVATCFGLMM